MTARVRAACRWALVAALAPAALMGCGSDDEAGGASANATSEKTLRVGLVSEIAGFNDRSFNHLALEGLKQAQRELGVETRAIASASVADYVPNLTSLARQGHDLVIAVGFQMAEPVNTVARSFPDTQFALVDVSQSALPDKPANVLGLVFRQEQAGYLAGYLAGLFNAQTEGPGGRISAIGGQPVPPVKSWIAGFEAGVERADPDAEVTTGYAQTFADQAPCKQMARNQFQAGAQIIFHVAGGCGLGAVDEAKREQRFVIGVDADQSYLGPQVLTSALKKVDVAVMQAIEAAQKGALEGGRDETFDLAGGAVGLGKISSQVPKSIRDRVDAVREEIASGELTVPGATG